MSSPWREHCIPHLQMPINPLHTIPMLHRKLWMEQKKAIRATSLGYIAITLIKAHGKPTLTSAQAKRLDALGIKFEDLLNLYLESSTRETFHTVLKERVINSKPLREKLEKALGHTHYTSTQHTVSCTPAISYSCRTLLLRNNQITKYFTDVITNGSGFIFGIIGVAKHKQQIFLRIYRKKCE